MESMAPLESTKRPRSAPTLGRNRRAISFPHGPLSSGVMPKKDLSNGVAPCLVVKALAGEAYTCTAK
jgi:hypothetical protein